MVLSASSVSFAVLGTRRLSKPLRILPAGFVPPCLPQTPNAPSTICGCTRSIPGAVSPKGWNQIIVARSPTAAIPTSRNANAATS